MGVNNGLRVGDLPKIKLDQIWHMKPGLTIVFREDKTGKVNVLMMNRWTCRVLRRHLEELSPTDVDFLFKSAKDKNQPLTTSSVNPKGYCGAPHRKTFGYLYRTQYGVVFEVLAKRFNHSNSRIIMR